MTTIAKFYLHDATSGDTGTLPGTDWVYGTPIPANVNASGSATNRLADGTIGSGQVSGAATTLAQTTPNQSSFIRRFLSDPIAAQTISAQTVTASIALAESSLNSNFLGEMFVGVWRPGTGASVGQLIAQGATELVFTEPVGTTQEAQSKSNTCSSVTAQDGDILVFEFGRSSGNQAMATAYTNTFYYDGTTEASATNCASFVSFTNAITMQAAPAANPPYRNQMPPLIAQ